MLKFLIKIGITILLLGSILFVLDTELLARALTGISRDMLLLGISLSICFVFLRILKWKLLAEANGMLAPFSDLSRAMLAALALGLVTPGRVGEVAALAAFPPEQRTKGIMVYLYDRIGELCTVLMFAVPAALLFLGWLGAFVAGGIIIGCILAISLIESRALRISLGRVTKLNRVKKINEILEADVKAPAHYWGASVVTYLFAYALIIAFVIGVEPITDLRAIAILPVVTLSNLVTITVGGLGVREGLAALMAPFGELRPEVAAGAFFLSFFFTRVVAGLIGVVWQFAARVPSSAVR